MGRRNRKVHEDDIIALTNLLYTMVAALVDEPEDVHIRCSNGATEVVLDLETAESDVPFVLGHHRTNFNHIEGIMFAASRARGVGIRVKYAPAG